MSVITEIRRKFEPPPRVRPFKITQNYRNRHKSVSYLWLPISDP